MNSPISFFKALGSGGNASHLVEHLLTKLIKVTFSGPTNFLLPRGLRIWKKSQDFQVYPAPSSLEVAGALDGSGRGGGE